MAGVISVIAAAGSTSIGCTKTITVPKVKAKCLDRAPVDVLFVLDNAGTAIEERERISDSLDAFVHGLVDSSSALAAVEDLHLGVITADVDAELNDAGCFPPSSDGALHAPQDGSAADCEMEFQEGPNYAQLTRTHEEAVDRFVRAARCSMSFPADGCGVSQPLEASVRALFPTDTQNEGFLRADSLLVLVFVTHRDDCSIEDYDEWLATRTDGTLRCSENPALRPIEEYAAIFESLRPERPDLLQFVSIAGFPTGTGVTTNIESLIEDPRMQTQQDDVCMGSHGSARPSLRLASFSGEFEQSLVASICDDESPIFGDLALRIRLAACAKYAGEADGN